MPSKAERLKLSFELADDFVHAAQRIVDHAVKVLLAAHNLYDEHSTQKRQPLNVTWLLNAVLQENLQEALCDTAKNTGKEIPEVLNNSERRAELLGKCLDYNHLVKCEKQSFWEPQPEEPPKPTFAGALAKFG
jgi:hypothetical protein